LWREQQKQPPIARQRQNTFSRLGKLVSAATNQYTKIKEMLEVVFSVGALSTLSKENMVMILVGLGTKNHFIGDGQQQFTRPSDWTVEAVG
jgi:hypothetical protein